jgi:hypothetical protein
MMEQRLLSLDNTYYLGEGGGGLQVKEMLDLTSRQVRVYPSIIISRGWATRDTHGEAGKNTLWATEYGVDIIIGW